MKHDPYHFNPPASACDGKEGFLSWKSADRIIKRKQRAAKARGDDIPQFSPYFCRYCRFYHVGGRSK
jgi:hypothetical protein